MVMVPRKGWNQAGHTHGNKGDMAPLVAVLQTSFPNRPGHSEYKQINKSLALGPHPVVLSADAWLYAERSFLTVHRGPPGMPGMELRSVVFKINTLPAVLSLRP